jgi:hypothetical protein
MAKVTLSFNSKGQSFRVPEWGPVELKPYQILMLVSITEQGYETFPRTASIVPALFDTGNSHCLTLSEEQLKVATAWGMRLDSLGKIYRILDAGGNTHKAEAIRADVWVHNYKVTYNKKSECEIRPFDDHPVKLSLAQEGIACVKNPRARSKEKPSHGLSTVFQKLVPPIFKRTDDLEVSHESTSIGKRLHDPTTTRLSFPHLPLLGLRALCLNSLHLEMICAQSGGTLTIESR